MHRIDRTLGITTRSRDAPHRHRRPGADPAPGYLPRAPGAGRRSGRNPTSRTQAGLGAAPAARIPVRPSSSGTMPPASSSGPAAPRRTGRLPLPSRLGPHPPHPPALPPPPPPPPPPRLAGSPPDAPAPAAPRPARWDDPSLGPTAAGTTAPLLHLTPTATGPAPGSRRVLDGPDGRRCGRTGPVA